jgi:DNA-binding beta-propeller fold protein YncE
LGSWGAYTQGTNQDVENTNDKIYRITEAGVATLMLDCPGDYPRGLTWDGTYFWHCDMPGGGTGLIYKINTSGVVQSSFSAAGSDGDLAWDGTYIWGCYHDWLGTAKICKYNTSGVLKTSFASPGDYPFGLTHDGTYLWHSDSANTIYKLGTAAGAVYGTFDTTSIDTSPRGLAHDEPYLWLVGNDNKRIYKLGAYDYKLIANT